MATSGAMEGICPSRSSSFIARAWTSSGIPAPATLELLRGVPVRPGPVEAELVTPTGAALVTTLAERFGPPPAMTIERVGHGAGSRETKGRPGGSSKAPGGPED